MQYFWKSLGFVTILAIILSSMGCVTTIPYWQYTQRQTHNYIVHPPDIPVWIDATFTPSQIEEIRAALMEWNYVLNGHIKIHLVEKKVQGIDHKIHSYPNSFSSWELGKDLQKRCQNTGLGWVVYNLPSDNPHLDKEIDENTLAFVDGKDGHSITIISDRFGSRSIKDVTMHEIAHLLGANHINAPSLEYPYYGSRQYGCIDKITVAQIANEHNLNLASLITDNGPFLTL